MRLAACFYALVPAKGLSDKATQRRCRRGIVGAGDLARRVARTSARLIGTANRADVAATYYSHIGSRMVWQITLHRGSGLI